MEFYQTQTIVLLCLLAVILVYNVVLFLLLRGDRIRAAAEASLLQEQEQEQEQESTESPV